MPNSIIPSAAEGLTNESLTSHGSISCGIDMAVLRKMSMKELHDFREVMHIVGEILAGFSCQPRFSKGEDRCLNSAGELIEDVVELVSGYAQAAVSVAKAATPTGSDAVKWRGWTILGFEADMADDLAGFAVLATRAVSDEAKAKFREEH